MLHIFKGWTEKFRGDVASTPCRSVVLAGKVGHIAKGVALIAVGLVTADIAHHPSKPRGLDGALHSLVSLPLGQLVLVLVTAWFAAFGVCSFSRSRRTKT